MFSLDFALDTILDPERYPDSAVPIRDVIDAVHGLDFGLLHRM